jgi:hypothetical protein
MASGAESRASQGWCGGSAQTEFDLDSVARSFSGSSAKAGAGSGDPKERRIVVIGIAPTLSNAARGSRAAFGDADDRIQLPH